MENTVVIFTSDNGAGERCWSYTFIFPPNFSPLTNSTKCLFPYKSTQIRITKLSVKQTCLSKACVDPSMKWDIFQIKQTCWKPLKLFKNTNKTEFYFVSGSLESASTRLQPSYGFFQLGNEVKTKKKWETANKTGVRWTIVPCRDSAIKSLGINKILFVKHCNINNTICLTL